MNEKYINRKDKEFIINYNNEIIGIGPLNGSYRKIFIIENNGKELFRVAIDMDDFFLDTIKIDAEQTNLDKEKILRNLGLLKVKIQIETGEHINKHFMFNSSKLPYDYKLAIAQLNNQLNWAKILLVQDNNSDKFIVFDSKRHWIPDPITRNSLGYNKKYFVKITDNELEKFPASENIESIKNVRLIRDENNSDPVYAVFNVPVLEKRHIPNPPTLDAIERKQDEVEYISTDEFNAFPTGDDILSVNHWDISVTHVSDLQEIEYEVSLSYASEDYPFVKKVADILRIKNVNYYLDQHEDMWGKDLTIKLQDVYKNKSGFVVPFISKYYANKVWPTYEFKNALTKAIELKREYILPVRFDNTELPGLITSIVYLDAKKLSPEDIAEKIERKIQDTLIRE